jgi:hypothetical protein
MSSGRLFHVPPINQPGDRGSGNGHHKDNKQDNDNPDRPVLFGLGCWGRQSPRTAWRPRERKRKMRSRSQRRHCLRPTSGARFSLKSGRRATRIRKQWENENKMGEQNQTGKKWLWTILSSKKNMPIFNVYTSRMNPRLISFTNYSKHHGRSVLHVSARRARIGAPSEHRLLFWIFVIRETSISSRASSNAICGR